MRTWGNAEKDSLEVGHLIGPVGSQLPRVWVRGHPLVILCQVRIRATSHWNLGITWVKRTLIHWMTIRNIQAEYFFLTEVVTPTDIGKKLSFISRQHRFSIKMLFASALKWPMLAGERLPLPQTYQNSLMTNVCSSSCVWSRSTKIGSTSRFK